MLLALWVAAWATGIAAWLLNPIVGVGALTGGLALGLWRGWRRDLVLGIAGLALAGGGLQGRQATRSRPLSDAVERAVAAQRPAVVIARIISGPDPSGPGGAQARLRLACESIDGRAVDATLSLGVLTGWPDVAPGDTVKLSVRVHRPMGLANPGLPDQERLARAHGIDLVGAVPTAMGLERLSAGSGLNARRQMFFLRQRMGRVITDGASSRTSGFLAGVLLGQRAAIAAPVEDGFRAAGATHVLSVSGLHLASVAALLFLLFRWAASLWTALALRLSPTALAAALSIPAVILYTLLTGEAVATVRSALMALVAFGAVIVRRPFSLAAGIALSALALLLASPLVLLDVSFQLSFASVVALGLFAASLRARLGKESRPLTARGRALRWLGRSLAASTAAAALTAPLVAHHFAEITPIAPLGNLVLVPVVELLVVPVGLAAALLGTISAPAGHVVLLVADGAARAALAAAEFFRAFAPVWRVRSPDAFETAALMVAGVLGMLAIARTGRHARGWWIAAVASAVVASGSLWARDVARRHMTGLSITFLDVGQGDAALVQGPAGFTALIDGGGTYDDSFDPGERVIEPLLRARGIDRLNLVVLSHPHPDHLNGLRHVLERFGVDTVWTSGDDGNNPVYRQFIAAARSRGIATPQPVALSRGALAVIPVAPWLDDRIAAPPGVSVNDASLVVKVALAGRAVLFAGDLEADGEAELVARGALGISIGSDVLKVPHHGSRTSSTDELLDAVKPGLAVISLGRDNRFHFPAPAVLERYRMRGVRVLRTDVDGAISLDIDESGGLRATCARDCR